jgi:hypothetical protein
MFCSLLCKHRNQSIILRGHKMKPEAKKKLIKFLRIYAHNRPRSHNNNISKSLKGKFSGEKNFNWRGGMYKSQGRYYIRANEHPLKHANGYILYSRYIAEQVIGRLLTRQEAVHHLNFQKDDDRPENLYLFPSDAEHSYYHKLLRTRKIIPITESNLSNCKEHS